MSNMPAWMGLVGAPAPSMLITYQITYPAYYARPRLTSLKVMQLPVTTVSQFLFDGFLDQVHWLFIYLHRHLRCVDCRQNFHIETWDCAVPIKDEIQ